MLIQNFTRKPVFIYNYPHIFSDEIFSFHP